MVDRLVDGYQQTDAKYVLNVSLKTLQTTTVAAQASVTRRDMAVVTAVRNVSYVTSGFWNLQTDK